jgi:hypothetical protein
MSPKRFGARTTSGPFLLEVGTTLEPIDGGTRRTTSYRGENRGFITLTEPVAIRVARKQSEAANENFKRWSRPHPSRPNKQWSVLRLNGLVWAALLTPACN